MFGDGGVTLSERGAKWNEKNEMYAIKNCSIKNERNIGSQKVMKRGKYNRSTSSEKKKGKYIRSKSGEKKDREIYSINEWWKERKENICDQRMVKRKTAKYIWSKSGEKKERKIYAIKSRVGARWCTGQMQSHLKECSQRWKKLDWNRFPLSELASAGPHYTLCTRLWKSQSFFSSSEVISIV